MRRLITRAELVARVNVGKAYVYRECGDGGRLYPAMVGTKVDLEHPSAYAFCKQYDYKEPDVPAMVKEARKKAPPPAPAHDTIPPDMDTGADLEGARDYMDMSLRDIVKNYGRQAQFKEYVAAYKILIQTQASEEKMARERGEYIHRVHAERLIAHIDGLQKALLTDAIANMTDTAVTLTKAGADKQDIERAMRGVISRTIKTAKQQAERSLRNA